MGMVPGWLRAGGRWHVLTESSAGSVRPRGRNRSPDRSAPLPGLRAPSQPVPVLRVDGESAALAADVGGHGGQDGSGQASLRSHVVLGGGASREPSRRLLPQGAGLPERTSRQLGSPRRASLPRRDAEPAPAAAPVAE